MRLARPARDGGDEGAALVAQALAALVGRLPRGPRRARRGRGEGGQRGGRRRRRGVAEQLQRLAGLGRAQDVVVAARARPQRAERLARLGAVALLGDRLARRLLHERVVALLLDLGGQRLQPRVRGEEEVAHLLARRGGAPDEAPDDLAEEQLRARRRRVDADAQARHVDALGDHQHGHEPAPGAGGEARDPLRRAGGLRGHDLGPLAAHPREPVGQAVGVLHVDRHDEPAGLRVRAGAQVRQAASASRSTCAIQSPSGSSAVRRRRAASAAGRPTEKSARRRPSLIHSMSPS